MLIPIKLLDAIKFGIESSVKFINLNEKLKLRLTKCLVSLWIYIYETQRNDEDITTLKGYTNIKKDKLDRFSIILDGLSIRYTELIEFLETHNLLQKNQRYSVGAFPKSYRILTDFLELNFIEFEIDFNKIFENLKDKKYWIKKYPAYKKQINETYEVKINLTEYIKWITDNIGTELKPIINNGILERRFLTKERAYDYINDAIKINLGNIWFKVSDEGRFYNSTTNLSYTAIPHITLKRRKVKEIDVVNCQPLLLCGLIKNKIYKKDVEDGIFYEKMANELGKTRNEFKILSYKYIFFSNKELKSGAIYDALNKLYPNFIKELNELRKEISISRELQKIESSIFVDKISNYDYKMILRHDAVFVYEEDYEIVKALVKGEFKKLGLNVSIK
jgi:hypothetical protein